MHYQRWSKHADPLYEVIARRGLAKTRNYIILKHIVQRCTNPKNKAYADYGGRGIKVCDRWRGTYGLVNFCADMGIAPAGKSIDRIDNDGDYEPSNCRWSTSLEQANNKRVYRTSRSGVSGITWYGRDQKWRVAIQVNGRQKHLGYADTIDKAKIILLGFSGLDKQVHHR